MDVVIFSLKRLGSLGSRLTHTSEINLNFTEKSMELAIHGCGRSQLKKIGEPGVNTNSYIDDRLRSI